MKFYLFLFLLSLSGELIMPHIFPTIRILGFLPLIIFAIARLSLPKALWWSMFAGLAVDLYSFGTPLGFFSTNYTLSTLIIYKYKKFFSEEKLLSYALFGSLFGALSTLLHFVLYSLIDIHLKPSLFTFATDLICMPIIDGVYILVWALLPLMLYKYLVEPKRVLFYKNKLGRLLHELSRITR